MNYQPPWLVATLRFLRGIPVVRRLPAALDWRDKEIDALTRTLRAVEDQLRRSETELRAKENQLQATQAELRARAGELQAVQAELRAREADVKAKEAELRDLPGSTELELYRLRSQLNRAVARAEQERVLRLDLEDSLAAGTTHRTKAS